jgi:hypothetical protein
LKRTQRPCHSLLHSYSLKSHSRACPLDDPSAKSPERGPSHAYPVRYCPCISPYVLTDHRSTVDSCITCICGPRYTRICHHRAPPSQYLGGYGPLDFLGQASTAPQGWEILSPLSVCLPPEPHLQLCFNLNTMEPQALHDYLWGTLASSHRLQVLISAYICYSAESMYTYEQDPASPAAPRSTLC